MNTWRTILWLFLLAMDLVPCRALLEGLYCGKRNCYDVLGVTRSATKAEIGKAYRILARKYHPDLHRTSDAKAEAEELFISIATAYEILKDDESRNDYDYMLDNPDEYYAHYYRYYRHRMAPKVDVRIVIVVVITIISIIQYYSGWQRYDSAIKYIATVPKYRNKALEIARAEINDKINNRKGKQRLSKAEQKQIIESTIQKVIVEKMDVKGGYAKPTLWNVLWIQIIICPYTFGCWILWHLRWFWLYSIRKQAYGREEQLYLIRRHLKMGQNQFDALEDEQVEEFLRSELWIREKFDIWKAEQEEEMRKKLAESARYKSYRRYMKNHGPGRITFED